MSRIPGKLSQIQIALLIITKIKLILQISTFRTYFLSLLLTLSIFRKSLLQRLNALPHLTLHELKILPQIELRVHLLIKFLCILQTLLVLLQHILYGIHTKTLHSFHNFHTILPVCLVLCVCGSFTTTCSTSSRSRRRAKQQKMQPSHAECSTHSKRRAACVSAHAPTRSTASHTFLKFPRSFSFFCFTGLFFLIHYFFFFLKQ